MRTSVAMPKLALVPSPDPPPSKTANPVDRPGPRGLYRIADGRYWWVPPGDDPEPMPLSDFVATARRIVRDDDAIRFEVEVEGPRGRAQVVVSEAELASLRWTARIPGLAVAPGAQAHLRAALSVHSAELPEIQVATRLGWHEVEGRHVYVHGHGVTQPPSSNCWISRPTRSLSRSSEASSARFLASLGSASRSWVRQESGRPWLLRSPKGSSATALRLEAGAARRTSTSGSVPRRPEAL